MAAAVLDTAHLASYTSIPQSDIQTLINEPHPELVNTFLKAISAKAQEHERLESERLRLDVELENAVHGGESRSRTLKANADKALQDVEALRVRLNEEENTRTRVEEELRSLRDSTSTSSTEVEGLKARISKLESENRENLALLDSKNKSHDSLKEELKTQHEKNQTVRRELSGLEERIQQADYELSNTKYRESSLQQQVEQLKRSAEWSNSELKTQGEAYKKYRQEKTAKITELQRTNEDAASNISSLQRTETSLRKRLEEVGQKADDAFTKVQQLQEDATSRESSFQTDLGNSRRLFDMQKQSADTARKRVEELDEQVEQLKAEAADEIGQIQAELETEREGRESGEQKIEELEARVEQLTGDLANAQRPQSVPGTPRNRGTSLLGAGTPGRAGSPALSARSRGGISFTQLYNDYNNIKAELDHEKRSNERLRREQDKMLSDLEAKGPEMYEWQQENGGLQTHVEQLAAQMQRLNKEKEELGHESRKLKSKATASARQVELITQQHRDACAQIRTLLLEMQVQQDGTALNQEELQSLRQLAKEPTNEMDLDGQSDTQQFISHRYATFKDTMQLQQKYTQMLQLTRQAGDFEETEKRLKKENHELQDEVEKQKKRVERYKEEMSSITTTSQSYLKERDTLRQMLERRKTQSFGASGGLSFSGESINGVETPTKVARSIEDGDAATLSKQLSEYGKLLKDTQSQYETYRLETATDQRSLKEQIDQLTKDRNNLQGENARTNSQLTLARERLEMLQSNYNMLKSENDEIQKRSQSLAEAAAKQDIRTHQVAEDLVEANQLTESMRNEIANLKAERELWKRIETRMNEDNQSLFEEKGRLNKSLGDMQNLYNERERTESETRRQLNNQVSELESQLRTAQRKLEEETESSKNAALRHGYEQKQSQAKIDDYSKTLSSAKEELIAAKTTRDQLQARVEELKIDLRNAQEHAQALRPRPTPRPAATSNGASGDANDVVSREQELEIEIADLKRDVEIAKSELENAHAQVEQYKKISADSEEELSNLTETHEEYRDDMEKVSREKDEEIEDLKKEAEKISGELSTVQSQLAEMQATAEQHNSHLDQQKTQYEQELARVKDESERHQEAAKFHQEDLKAQAEISQQAQERYENELQQHAEAAKNLQKTRADYSNLKLDLSTSRADAEAARMALSQNEESWTSTKNQYETELFEIRKRRDDVDKQNKLLHQQLESVSSQISALKQKRTSLGGDEDADQGQDTDLQKLTEVIKYLRQEKEIVDVQLELSGQEASRLRQQLSYVENQRDEFRVKLERQQQGDSDKTSASHKKLAETINELNVFRESSATLREETRRAQRQLAEKNKKVQDLTAEIEPLKASLRTFENEKETTQGEMKLLQEDRDRWHQRTQQILQKQDRPDPADVENLKQQISSLEGERDSVVSEHQKLQARIDRFPEEVETARDEVRDEYEKKRETMIEQFKGRSRELSVKIKNEQTTNKTLSEQLETVKAELEQVRAGVTTAQPAVLADVQMTDRNAREHSEEGEIGEGQTSAPAPTSQSTALQTDLDRQMAKVSELQARITELEQQVATSHKHSEELQSQLNTKDEELASAQTQLTVTSTRIAPEEAEKLREELSAAQQEVENLKNQAAETASINQQVQSGSGDVAEQVAKIRQELEAGLQEKLTQNEERYSARVDSMKAQLNQKLREGRTAQVEQVSKEHEEAMQNIKQEHDKMVQKINSEHDEVVNALKSEHEQTTNRMTAEHEQQLKDLRSTAPPEQNAAAQAQPVQLPLQPGQKVEDMELSQDQARALVAKNTTIRDIVTRNIKSKIEQDSAKLKEAHSNQLEEVEHAHTRKLEEAEKKMSDLRENAEKMKENAVSLAEKRNAVKLSMAERKASVAQVKLDFVSKSASETPQRAVLEIWETAKDLKAPAAAAPNQVNVQTPAMAAARSGITTNDFALTPQQQPATQSTPATQEAKSSPDVAPPAPAENAELSKEAVPATSDPAEQAASKQDYEEPASAGVRRKSQDQGDAEHQQKRRRSGSAIPRPGSRRNSSAGMSGPPRRLSQSGQGNQDRRNSQQGNAHVNSNLPAKPPPQNQGAGTGPGALRGLANQAQNSGIPRGGGGNNNFRGRGSGIRNNQGNQGQARLPDTPLSTGIEVRGRGGFNRGGQDRGGHRGGRGSHGGHGGQGGFGGLGGGSSQQQEQDNSLSPMAQPFLPAGTKRGFEESGGPAEGGGPDFGFRGGKRHQRGRGN
ncbi:MAG: hypothetical protein M1831_005399 [Alyxoria varia]|nr:MAG: hypothetical protein M1831_005399 [Alyxoria varia]